MELEQRRAARARETGAHRENTSSNGNVRLVCHALNSEVIPPGLEPGSSWAGSRSTNASICNPTQTKAVVRLDARNLSYKFYFYSKASFTLPRKVVSYSARTETAPRRVSFRPPPVLPPSPRRNRPGTGIPTNTPARPDSVGPHTANSPFGRSVMASNGRMAPPTNPLIASRLGEQGSIPCGDDPGVSHMGSSRFPALSFRRCSELTSLHPLQDHDGNTERPERRSDEALGVRVNVARIASSLLDLGCGVATGVHPALKIRSNLFTTHSLAMVISQQCPDEEEDKELFEIIKTHMVRGPYGGRGTRADNVRAAPQKRSTKAWLICSSAHVAAAPQLSMSAPSSIDGVMWLTANDTEPAAATLLRHRHQGGRFRTGFAPGPADLQTLARPALFLSARLPTRRTGFNPRPGHPGFSACGDRVKRCRWSTEFIEDLPFPPPFNSSAAPCSNRFTPFGSQDHDVKSHPNLQIFSLTHSRRCNGEGFFPTLTIPSMRNWLHYSPPKAYRVRFPAGSPPDYRMWESCRTMPLVGGFSRGSPVSPRPCYPALLHTKPHFTLIGSQHLDVKSRPNLSTHSAWVDDATYFATATVKFIYRLFTPCLTRDSNPEPPASQIGGTPTDCATGDRHHGNNSSHSGGGSWPLNRGQQEGVVAAPLAVYKGRRLTKAALSQPSRQQQCT
ncbi:hypothetical protein PR048_004171, partial [Dryococelus australis]